MSMPWFKVYDEAQTDPKLESLTDAQFRVWFKLLCLANKQEERGRIVGYEDLDLLAVEVARGDTDLLRATLTRLAKLRIVAWSEEEGTTEFINFTKRQARKPSDEPAAATERKRRQRARDKQKPANVTPLNKVDNTRHAMSRDVTPLEEDIEEDIERDSYVIPDIEAKEQTGEVKKRGVAVASDTPPTPHSTKAHSFPDSFTVTGAMELWAAKTVPELDIGIATEEWETSMRSNRTKYKYTDWTLAWYNAMRNAAKWAAERNGKHGKGTANSRGYSGTNGSPKDEATARSLMATMERRENRRPRSGYQEEPSNGRPGAA